MLNAYNVDIGILFPTVDFFYFPKSAGNFYVNQTYNFESKFDGAPIIKTFNNFNIGTHGVVSVSNRCKGLYLCILGDCFIDGVLSMTAKGASGPGKNVGINLDYGIFHCESEQTLINKFDIENDLIIPSIGNASGQTPKNRQSGYGGTGGFATSSSGSYPPRKKPSAGQPGTAFAGGVGGGGDRTSDPASQYSRSFDPKPSVFGGIGGIGGFNDAYNWGTFYTGGGGAGFPGATGAYSGGTGAGGTIVLIIHGRLKVNLNAKIESNGVNGGRYGSQSTQYGSFNGGYGGGSGGGSINIFCGDLINYGSITANGRLY